MTQEPGPWVVSRYPAGYRFAFTIVHDADSAYRERLAPLFDVFDELGLRITTSVFAFWADWAEGGAILTRWRQSEDPDVRFRAPKAVPLCEPEEQRFYRQLSERGHEIALHSPSDTSSTRDQVICAFELFKNVFGQYPAVYTEHSSRSNKDAQTNEGSDPDSPYYCLDALTKYQPWVWIDAASGLREDASGKSFEIPPNESPINRDAQERYGLSKVFVRTGAWSKGDGDGFLQCYSEKHLDALERDGGMALVYTHLDANWLDPKTRRMREDIRRRLQYLAAKPGWFVPASRILDRVVAVEAVRVVCDAHTLTLTNTGSTRLEELLVRAPETGEEVVIESIDAAQTVVFDRKNRVVVG